MSNQIQNKVEGNISKSQREFYLRQQLKAIQEELAKSRGKGGAVGGEYSYSILSYPILSYHILSYHII